ETQRRRRRADVSNRERDRDRCDRAREERAQPRGEEVPEHPVAQGGERSSHRSAPFSFAIRNRPIVALTWMVHSVRGGLAFSWTTVLATRASCSARSQTSGSTQSSASQSMLLPHTSFSARRISS